MKLVLSLLLISFAIIGISDAGYISWYELQQIIPPCGTGFDCGTVLNSPWAHVGPIPLAYLGVFFYLTVLILSILHFLDLESGQISKSIQKILPKWFPVKSATVFDFLWPLTLLGFLFSLYLVGIMAYAIGEWCNFCLLSAGTSSALFLVSTIYLLKVYGKSSTLVKWLVFKVMGFCYRRIAKPIFFLFDAETIHQKMISLGSLFGKIEIAKFKISAFFSYKHPDLQQNFDGVTFPNRVGLAAGFDYNGDLTQILPSVGFGWHTIGTVTLQPYEGNKKPRLGRFPNSKALLVNKGLKSIGAREVIAKLEKLPLFIPTAISIASTNTSFDSEEDQLLDILQSFLLFENSEVRHKLYEINISCPNTFGGEPYTTPKRLEQLLSSIDKLKLTRPLYIKMPIDQSQKETIELLRVADKHSVQGVIFGNLTKDKNNPAVLPEDRKSWTKLKGNLSGRPTFDRSNAHIKTTKEMFKNRFTIVGTGGIFSGEDALKKLELGADLVQLISGMIFQGPQVIGEINQAIQESRS